MITVGVFAPSEELLQVGGDTYVCRLPLERVAELQATRGFTVTYPDGSRGKRPKPMGTIWREHLQSGDYDAEDSYEIIFQSLIGGASVTRADGSTVKVDRSVADTACKLWFAPMPHEERWQVAMAILIACCQGHAPAEDAPPGNAEAASSGNGPSITPPPSETARSGESAPATPPV